jgi:multicomponent Na+:H+ antiporter subunit F
VRRAICAVSTSQHPGDVNQGRAKGRETPFIPSIVPRAQAGDPARVAGSRAPTTEPRGGPRGDRIADRDSLIAVLQTYLGWLALFLLLTLAAGLVRIVRGPRPADRMLAIQLFGTTCVALLLVLGEIEQAEALTDVALVFALLSLLVLVAFVARVPPDTAGTQEHR